MSRDTYAIKTNSVVVSALASSAMAYGWGYRGIVGHEGGAMVPGAMLGMALCLGSGRPDWYRRAAVAGLLGAVGWAWGGSLSYMEHTLYAVSDSFPDVLYGYTMLFFLGALWAGIGGGVLGLAILAVVDPIASRIPSRVYQTLTLSVTAGRHHEIQDELTRCCVDEHMRATLVRWEWDSTRSRVTLTYRIKLRGAPALQRLAERASELDGVIETHVNL